MAIKLGAIQFDMAKKLIMGVVFLLFVYILGGYVRGLILVGEAEETMERLFSAFAQPWSVDSVRNISSYALRATPIQDVEKRVAIANAVLGDFVRIAERPKCSVDRGVDMYSKETYTYALCSAIIDFAKRSTGMSVRLVKQEGQWLLDDFSISPRP